MDELIKSSLNDINIASPLTLWELTAVLMLSSILSIIVAWAYSRTHSGHSYSRSYVHTMIFVSVTIALIMVIIGSNIARAFALVGAMSIVRFRNPVKDSRDIAFLFICMAIGMAAGTKFYLFAIIFTAFICCLTFGLNMFNFGSVSEIIYVARLRMRDTARKDVEGAIAGATNGFAVVSIDKLAQQDGFSDYIYELSLPVGTSFDRLIETVSGVSDELDLTLLVGEGNVHV